MDSLKEALNKFWNWAGISPLEYSRNRGFGEWEENYPYWDQLEKLFIKTIKNYHLNSNSDTLDSILQAIGLDHESGNFLDIALEEFNNNEKFINQLIMYYMPEVRWQIALKLRNIEIPNKQSYLDILSSDENQLVSNAAKGLYDMLNKKILNKMKNLMLEPDLNAYLVNELKKVIKGEINFYSLENSDDAYIIYDDFASYFIQYLKKEKFQKENQLISEVFSLINNLIHLNDKKINTMLRVTFLENIASSDEKTINFCKSSLKGKASLIFELNIDFIKKGIIINWDETL